MAFNPNEVDSNKVIESLTNDIAQGVREKAMLTASLAKALDEVGRLSEVNAQLGQKLNEISSEVAAIKAAQGASSEAARTVIEGDVVD